MKKEITFKKNIEFPTMIGEITAISLDKDLKFIDESNVEGNLFLTGKYKMTEASRLENEFNYKIPIEVTLSEKIDLNTSEIEISDFYYEIDENNLINHIELCITGTEVLENEIVEEVRECDGDMVIEKEIPTVEGNDDKSEIEEDSEEQEKDINSLFTSLDDDTDTYGTLLVYIVRQNETINNIIEKYNTTLEELEKYNDLKNISIGTKLIIPIVNE